MEIKLISDDKKQFLELLLLADEQENMIDQYLERGDLFALYGHDRLKSICVVTQESANTFELKNLVTAPKYQGCGYASALINFICTRYTGNTMLVGTGETPFIIGFYEKFGFRFSHRIANFFIAHYDHPMIEDGILLKDMVYLKKDL